MIKYSLVGIGAAIGATGRFFVSTTVKRYILIAFPIATLIINLLGCFLMGVILGNNILGNGWTFLGIGVLGGFTTFSTWMNEIAELIDVKNWRNAILYLILSFFGGWTLVWLGMVVSK